MSDNRAFDTTGTILRRTGAVFTITCESGDVANRVADQLRSPIAEIGEIDSEDRMWKISKLIAKMQSVLEQFGDTCVYVRRGGMGWGAVALNREADDKKNGVFDLQAQHDRDMEERYGQVQRLIKSRDEFMNRAIAAEARLAELGTPVSSPKESDSG